MRASFTLLVLLLCAAPAAAQDEKPKPSLQQQINTAIDEGVKWLLTQQKPDGSFGQIGGPDYAKNPEIHRYPGGLTALSLLALMKCGVPVDDPVIEKGFDYLRKRHRQPRYTYDSAMIILAVEARANPFKREAARERFLEYQKRKKKRRSNRRRKEPLVKLDKDDRVWMQQLVTSLLKKRRDDRAWRYGVDQLDRSPAMRGNKDMSNTQLAALALQVATRCGMDIPDTVFVDTLKWLIDAQEQEGPEHVILPPGHRMEDTDVLSFTYKARGWPYLPGSRDAKEATCSGSMTAAGVASILICRHALEQRKSRALEDWLESRSDAAVLDGIAWLDKHWTMRDNPGNSHYRYLYFWGLERIGDLQRKNLIGRHPWYVEGAKTLVTEQKPDGKWVSRTHEPRDIISTAFALLFLDRASLAVTGE